MGFWHTGYMEFHEPIGIEEYTPINRVFTCSQCGEEFSLESDLREHRFTAHPVLRPILLVAGQDITFAPMRFVAAFQPHDVATSHAEFCEVNGERVDLTALGTVLAGQPNQSTTRVVLKGDGTDAEFTIVRDIAMEKDLCGVDTKFTELAHQHRLTSHSVQDFISACQPYKSAASYLEGLCEYLYGALARERIADTSLPYDAYVAKLNRAAEILSQYQRPFAATTCALIAFHFNQFESAAAFVPGSRVAKAAHLMLGHVEPPGERYPQAAAHEKLIHVERMLTDHDTESIMLGLFEPDNVKHHDHLRNLLRGHASSYDIPKIHMILAIHAQHSGNHSEARRHAGELRNNRAFETWADGFISSLAPIDIGSENE